LYILLAFLFLPNVFAGTYESAHFVIYSDLDPRYVDFIQANAEAYYQQMEQSYFRTGGPTRIKIYYSERQADTQELFNKHGLSGKAHYKPITGAMCPACRRSTRIDLWTTEEQAAGAPSFTKSHITLLT
jgi:hypothetical protein